MCNYQDNILLHDGKAYLTDFGISRIVAYKGLSTKVHGVLNFRAPELFRVGANPGNYLLEEDGFKPSTFSDVYSFGMMFYHVCQRSAQETIESHSHMK